MSETFVLNPFQQKAFGELCELAKAFHNAQALDEMQGELWQMLKAAVEPSDTNYQDAITISNMFSLYEQMEATITAVYGLVRGPFEAEKTKKKTKKKKTS